MTLIVGLAALAGIFILFLVLSKTLNNTINHLVKINYLLKKEFDLKKERAAIARLLEEEKNKPEPALENASGNGNESDSRGSSNAAGSKTK